METQGKRTMTLNLTGAEMEALERLSGLKDLTKTAVLRQALRLYQMIDQRARLGEKIYFENEAKEKAELMLI